MPPGGNTIEVDAMNVQMAKLKTVMQKQIDLLEQELVNDAAMLYATQQRLAQSEAELKQERDVIKPALLKEINDLKAPPSAIQAPEPTAQQ